MARLRTCFTCTGITCAALGVLFGLWGSGCKRQKSAGASVEPALDNVVPAVPMPAANGPKLLCVKQGTPVFDRPAPTGKIIGTLRAGAKVSRAADPYSKRGCAGGWYPIRPRGFVCAGPDASLDVELPIGRLLAEEPALDKALPYRYGRVRKGEAVLYGKLPSHDEQAAAEPKLAARGDKEPTPIGAGANDVPLDQNDRPNGVPVVQKDGEGVGPDGYRTSASWFVFLGPQLPPKPLAAGALLSGEENRVLKQHSGVAVALSFLLGEGKDERRFGVTPDGRFVPTDRLAAAVGTTWHGVDLSHAALPIAFAIRAGLHPHVLRGEHAQALDEEFEPKQAIALTGRFRTVDGTLFYACGDDGGADKSAEKWVRHKDVVLVLPRHRFPDFAAGTQKWIDISLANQTLIAWEGRRPVYATLVSTGSDRFGDPATGAPATLQGQFRIRGKFITRAVDDAEAKGEFSLTEVPWVLDFADGYAITGSYWQGHFGEPQNFHDVTMAPVDAHWLWRWTDIELPKGWLSATVADDAQTPVVLIHK